MNKVVNINLGGIPFTMDDDAYEHLRGYLDVIYRHFRQTEGYEEITSDIEARLAELFQESMGNRPIVVMKDVEEAIRIMGTPEEFGADEEPSSMSDKATYKTGKRLFRDPDDVVLGGVSAGIAAYFGIREPLWIRLLFVLLTLTGTFGVPIYLILWAIIPKAKTAADKLSMRGEPINVSSIGRIVQNEFENLSREVSDMANDITKKGNQGISAGDQFSQGLNEAFRKGGKFIQKGIELFSRISRPLLILIGAILIFSLATACMGTVFSIFALPPYLDLIFTDHFAASWVLPVNMLFLIGIPIAFSILGIARVFFRVSSSKGLRLALGGLWLINLLCLAFLIVQTGQEFREKGRISRTETLGLTGDTLYLQTNDLTPSVHYFDIDDKAFFHEGAFTYKGIDTRIKPSPDGQWQLAILSEARGESKAEAEATARSIQVAPSIAGQTLRLPNSITLRSGEKFRVQRVTAELLIPPGKYVQISGDALSLIQGMRYPKGSSPHLLQMTENGLRCESCPEREEEDRQVNWETLSDVDFSGYEEVEVSGRVQLRIERQDQFQFQLSGPGTAAMSQIKVEQVGNRLVIRGGNEGTGSAPRLFLGMPSLNSIKLDQTKDVRISGFDATSFKLVSSGAQNVKLEVNARSMVLDQSGSTEVDLGGTIRELNASLREASRLDADQAALETANLQLVSNSKAFLPPGTRLHEEDTDATSVIIRQ